MMPLSAILTAPLAFALFAASQSAADGLASLTPADVLPMRPGPLPACLEPRGGCRCDGCLTHGFYCGARTTEVLWRYGAYADFCAACRAEGRAKAWRERMEFCRTVTPEWFDEPKRRGGEVPK